VIYSPVAVYGLNLFTFM